jgi:hypothetical protein
VKSRRPPRRKTEAEARLADQALLATRLAELGLKGVGQITVHRNRTVMLTLSRERLRIHRGYAYAPDRVLEAIVTFLSPGKRRQDRRAAEGEFLGFPVHHYVPGSARRGERRVLARDRKVLEDLTQLYRRLNRQHFKGRLPEIPMRLSRRMRTRLGEFVLDPQTDRPVEIGISLYHVVTDGWEEVEQTLLHEMVHQWQAETGIPVDHGTNFRQKALEVGVAPTAYRKLDIRRSSLTQT